MSPPPIAIDPVLSDGGEVVECRLYCVFKFCFLDDGNVYVVLMKCSSSDFLC